MNSKTLPIAHRLPRTALIARASALVGITFVSAISARAADEKITYRDHIRPFFENACLNCHNPDEAKGGLDLSNYGAMMTGGSGGEVVVTEDPDSSRVYTLTTHAEEPLMPPKKPKSADKDLAMLKKWIEGGLLEHDGSVAKVNDKPKLDMSVKVDIGAKPTVIPMPEHLLLQPEVVTDRPATIPALARSPWAPIIAVAGQKQVLLYDSNDFELLGILAYPEGFPQALSFSQNGSLLLCGGGRGGKSGGVVVWDVKTGERVIEVGSEYDIVLAADISPDHRNVALGGPGKNIKIFDTVTGEELHSIKKHPDWLLTLAYSPDGVLLATGGRNGGLHIWEGPTGLEFYTLKGHTKAITDVAWRADSNVLASCSEDGQIILWEMNGGKQVKKWAAHGGGALAVAFAPDGKIVSTGRDKTVKIWDAAGKQLQSIAASDDIVMTTLFSHDGSKVISGDYNGKITVWNAADGKKIAMVEANPPTIDQQLAYSQKRITELQGTLPTLEAGIKTADAEMTAKQQALAATKKQGTDAAAMKAAMEKKVAEINAAIQRQTAEQAAAQKDIVAKQADAKAKADALAKENVVLAAAKADTTKWTAEMKKHEPTVPALATAVAAAKAAVDAAKLDAATQDALNKAVAAHAATIPVKQKADAALAAKTQARDAIQAQINAATAAKQDITALQAQLAAANAAMTPLVAPRDAANNAVTAAANALKPLRDKENVVKAVAAKALADHTAKTQQHAAAVKALNDSKAQLAAATKRMTDSTARLVPVQAADTAAKAAVVQATANVGAKNKALADSKTQLTAATAEAGKAVAQVAAVTKQTVAAEAAVQVVAKKKTDSQQAVDLAKAELQNTQYLAKKWQAAAVNLEAFEKAEELDEMEVALDEMTEEAETKKTAAEKAAADRAAAEAKLAQAEKTIKEGTRSLVEKSDDVLETALRLAQAKAFAGMKTDDVEETVGNGSEVTVAATAPDPAGKDATKVGNGSPADKAPAPAGDTPPAAVPADGKTTAEIEAELADLQNRLAELKKYIAGAYSEAKKTQEVIEGASQVAAATPAVVAERSRIEVAKKAEMEDAMKDKQQQETVVTNRKKEIETLRSKYLQILPKKPGEETPAPAAAPKPAAPAPAPAPAAKK